MTPELKKEMKKLTGGQEVPKELKNTVEQMSSALHIVEDPKESMKQRVALADTLQQLAITLHVVQAPKTSPDQEHALIRIVQPLTIVLKIIQDSPLNHRSTFILCGQQLTVTLQLIEYVKTPSNQWGQLAKAVEPLHKTLRVIQNPNTPPKQRKKAQKTVQPQTTKFVQRAVRVVTEPLPPSVRDLIRQLFDPNVQRQQKENIVYLLKGIKEISQEAIRTAVCQVGTIANNRNNDLGWILRAFKCPK